MSKTLKMIAFAATAMQPMAASAAAQSLPTAAPSIAIPSASSVAAFYNTYKTPSIWFRGGVASPAATQLVGILRRSSIEGLSFGPQLAATVEAAIAQAQSGNPAAVAAAEQTLSAAWVQYVQTIKRPTRGMDYISATLQPQGSRPDQILLTAAAAPSLERHLVQVSNVNALYAQIRDAAWAEAQASGNLTPDSRLLANLERARTIPGTGRFVVVDAAAQRLTMFENGQPVDSMKVIVGEPKFPTPMIASYIHYVTLNPYWDAPDHLVRTRIAPKTIAGGLKYFNATGYEVMADWTTNAAVIDPKTIDWKAVAAGKTQIRVRQKPGPTNFMLGIKIPFQNNDDIYLHDTPGKDLFKQANRALSNGCIRLEDAPRFARWLNGGRDPVAPSNEPEQHVQLAVGVPIYVTYLTAQPKDGRLTYTADFYGLDRSAGQLAAASR